MNYYIPKSNQHLKKGYRDLGHFASLGCWPFRDSGDWWLRIRGAVLMLWCFLRPRFFVHPWCKRNLNNARGWLLFQPHRTGAWNQGWVDFLKNRYFLTYELINWDSNILHRLQWILRYHLIYIFSLAQPGCKLNLTTYIPTDKGLTKGLLILLLDRN